MLKRLHRLAILFLLIGLLASPGGLSSLAALAPPPPFSNALRSSALSAPPAGVNGDWWSAVQEYLRESEYHIRWQDQTYLPDLPAAYQAPNRAHNLRTYFTPTGIRVIPRISAPQPPDSAPAWEWRLSLTGYGPAQAISPVALARLAVSDNRVEYRRGALIEWYVNDSRGLEQGFTLLTPPSPDASAPLILELSLSGSLIPSLSANAQAIEFVTPGGVTVLHYDHLAAHDAAGRALPARMSLTPRAVQLVIEARNAVYPLTIDPLAATPHWTAESNQTGAEFGFSAATAGDVNGDGYSDLIVGAPFYDNGQTNEGGAFVYHGSAAGPNTAPNWRAESNQTNGILGQIVNTLGDANGDGYADVLISALLYDNGQTDEGAIFVWYGSASGLGSNGTPANADWRAEGNQTNAHLGASAAPAGDVNGDGYSDLLAAADLRDNGQTDEGLVYVYRGSPTGLNTAPTWTAESNQSGARFGASVSTLGDANGDGFADIAIGAPQYDNGQTNEGAVFVWNGSAAGLGPSGTPANADWTAESDQASAEFGAAVSAAGDVNGDGFADLVIGDSLYDNGQTDEGAAFVFYGSAAGFGANGSPANADWVVESNQADARFGAWVSAAGDVNGDGLADVVVGAPLFEGGQTDEGRAFIYDGSTAGLKTAPSWTAESDQAGAQFGVSAASAGDVNGDGFADVIVGANKFDNGQTDEGRAFVYYGSPGSLSQAPGWYGEGNQANTYYGSSVATAGDVNGDGFADVIVGAYLYDGGQLDEGAVYVYHGSPTGLNAVPDWRAEGDQAVALFGDAVNSAGDVNGDGYGDVIVVARFYDNGETNEGAAFVWLGSSAGLGANGAPANADWMAEGNQADARFGASVGAAGDVNGDGYADLLAGAIQYDNGEADEGAAFVWLGSSAGLGANGAPANADWMAEGNQPGAFFGSAVSTAGDVNGDGFSDIVIGAHQFDNGQTNEGGVFVYYGSASGLGANGAPANAAWMAESNQNNARLGAAVGTAGDVNGDGFADVIVGARNYTNDQLREGRAYLYPGSAAGLSVAPSWVAEGDQADAAFGHAVGSAGDVTGDGYADVIVSALLFDNDLLGEGRAYVYYGNGGAGLSLTPRQRRADNGGPVAYLGRASSNTFRLAALGRSPFGRTRVKLEWEVEPLGVLFDGAGAQQSAAWIDTGATGTALNELVSNLALDTAYHWRVRLRYHPAGAPFQPYSRWLTNPWRGWQETRLRTATSSGICTPEFYESDIALVVDRSGSMNDNNKLNDAKAAISTFIANTMAPPDQLALASFSSAASLDQPLTTSKPLVDAAAQALTASGETRIDLGLQQARLELASARHLSHHRRIIILLTDGQQSGAGNDAVIAEAVAAKAEGAVIFAVGLGPDADNALLQQIVSNPSYYYYAPSGSQLSEIYQYISRALACPNLGGEVFLDQDNNGLYTPSLDTPLTGASLNLTGAAISSTTTNNQAGANYVFPRLSPGTYTVTLDLNSLPGVYQPTTPLSRVVTLEVLDDMDNHFGLRLIATATPVPNYPLYFPIVSKDQ
jgi:uncharacterized protein YegL